MKLLYLPASPYARKVRVLAHETGLKDQLTLQLLEPGLTPINPNQTLTAQNPIGKIPTLLLADGTALFDSRTICEYLDTLHNTPRMFPQDATRWQVLTQQATADGILDAAVLTRYETFLRPEPFRWSEWIENQKSKFWRALDALERDASSLQNKMNIGVISVACALGYLDFRYGDENWRTPCPNLAAWYETFQQRDSMQSTQPE